MCGLQCYVSLALLVTVACALPQQQQQREDSLLACGGAFYYADKVRVYSYLVALESDTDTDGFSLSILATRVISCVRSSMGFRL
jgi:hypothetical protein